VNWESAPAGGAPKFIRDDERQQSRTKRRVAAPPHAPELEALVFSRAARRWLGHLLAGGVATIVGVDAASMLLGRVRGFVDAPGVAA